MSDDHMLNKNIKRSVEVDGTLMSLRTCVFVDLNERKELQHQIYTDQSSFHHFLPHEINQTHSTP